MGVLTRRWRGLAAVAAVVAAAALMGAAVDAVGPEARATAFTSLVPRNQDKVIKLTSTQYIPDDGELNWPIYVGDSGSVKHVRVELRGAYHHWASDLLIKLHHEHTAAHHEGNAVTLVAGGTQQRSTGTHLTMGEPMTYDHPNVAGPEFPDPIGVGYDYAWEDDMGINLAFGKTAVQSTTGFGGVASRAVDGNVNGFYSSESVTHTEHDGTRLAYDAEPYWEVDLDEGDSQNIGTIRVWNRQQEPNRDEVQVVTTTSSGILAGSFTLSIDHFGSVTTTAAIAHNAVAQRRNEDTNVLTPGIGLGESMQAKIEALSNINSVKVKRTGPDSKGGYSWTVTFISEPGDLNEMTVASNDLTSVAASVSVRTTRNGNANVYYNYAGTVFAVTGRLFPAWVMLYDGTESVGDVSLEAARAAAKWRRRITVKQRETVLVLPANTTGRFVRVQLESQTNPLSLAEVQVYEKRHNGFASYEGGSPLAAVTYEPHRSVDEAFAGAEMKGHWFLSIEDLVAANVGDTTNSRPELGRNGRGAFDSWVLQITDSDDVVYNYETDIQAVIKTLPIYGTLYKYDVATGGRGDAIQLVEGQERYEKECYDNCDSRFGVGCPFSTSKDGDVAKRTNRLRAFSEDRSVVYAPNDDYLGADSFNYAIRLDGVESTRQKVGIDVRKCRARDDCANELGGDYIPFRRFD